MVATVVVVVDEVSNSLYQLSGELIGTWLTSSLMVPMGALQLPVGLEMKRCRQDVPDTYQVQIVPKGPGDITRTVVRKQPGAVLDRYVGHAGSINSFLNHLDERVG